MEITTMMKLHTNVYRTFLLLCMVAFSSALLAQDRPTFTQFEAYSALMAGRAQYEQGDYLVALRNFDRVVQLNEEFPEVSYSDVYLDRGNTLFALGRYNEAIADYSAGIDQSTRRVLSNQVSDAGAYTGDDRYQSVRIVDLDRNLDLEREYALLYHNRGVAKYYLGQYKEGAEDFEFALSISPELTEAQVNLENARLASGRNRFYEDTYASNSRSATPERVTNESKVGIWKRIFNKNEDVSRGDQTPVSSPRIGTPTNSYARTRYYADPKVAGQSFDYVRIESIEITPMSTLVNLRVSNLTRDSFPVRLFGPGNSSAFFITDRTRTRTYRLKSIQGLPAYPQSVQLSPNQALSITLEFEALPEGVGYIHMLEGNTQQGKEWNFYDVQID
jgi:hypothetical protein